MVREGSTEGSMLNITKICIENVHLYVNLRKLVNFEFIALTAYLVILWSRDLMFMFVYVTNGILVFLREMQSSKKGAKFVLSQL